MSEINSPVAGALADIEAKAAQLRVAVDDALKTVAGIDAQVSALRARHAEGMRAAAARVRDLRDSLLEAVRAARGAFRDPASVEVHGLKVGWESTGGGWQWPEQPALIAAVRATLPPSRACSLIEVTERIKVSTLTTADRERLGIPRAEVIEAPYVRDARGGTGALARILGITASGEAQP